MKGLLGWRRINMVEILDSDARCKLTTEKVRLIYLPHISAASTQSVIFTIALQTTKRVNSPPLHTHTHSHIHTPPVLPHFMQNKTVKLDFPSPHLSSNPFLLRKKKGTHQNGWQVSIQGSGTAEALLLQQSLSFIGFHCWDAWACVAK